MECDEIKVSVFLLAYKHAKYLRKCLDSILCQKTNFDFEIIVGEDCSNDGSEEILLEYQHKYPQIIIPLINDQNLGGTKNHINIRHKCRGQYIAGGESDDFWTDEYRLQKQVDFLDSHPEYVAVGTNYVDVDSDGSNPKVALMKWQVNKAYSINQLLKYGLIIHGNTIMYRNYSEEISEEFDNLRLTCNTMGDVITRVFLYNYGHIYLLPDICHAHRKGDKDPTSFFAQQTRSSLKTSYMYCDIVKALKAYYSNKYDLDQLIANRTGAMLLNIKLKKYTVDKIELDTYMSMLSPRVRALSYRRAVQKFFRKATHVIGRRIGFVSQV